jgi:hypothetical protein
MQEREFLNLLVYSLFFDSASIKSATPNDISAAATWILHPISDNPRSPIGNAPKDQN